MVWEGILEECLEVIIISKLQKDGPKTRGLLKCEIEKMMSARCEKIMEESVHIEMIKGDDETGKQINRDKRLYDVKNHNSDRGC